MAKKKNSHTLNINTDLMSHITTTFILGNCDCST